MNRPTFIEFLTEGRRGRVTPPGPAMSLADVIAGKGGPARTNYPKTNFKRYMDDWNNRLGKWVADARKNHHTVLKRVNAHPDSPMILDRVDGDKLVSTAVINGHDDLKSGNWTFDFYNQESAHGSNEFRVIPTDTEYDKNWEWKEMTGDLLHHSDQRNMFTSDKEGRTMANSRQYDGEEPREPLLRVPRRPVKFIDPKD